MGQPKVARNPLRSVTDCAKAMEELLAATLELEILVAQRDKAVAAAAAGYDASIDGRLRAKAALEEDLEAWYMAHIGDVETQGRRSLQLPNGIIGRRTSPPKLALLNRTWNWDAVLAKLRASFGKRFLRTPADEINKDLVKAELKPDELAAHGMKLAAKEEFYAEPARPPEPVP
jgi:Bacteriophage Mu Gam like protein